MRLRWYAVAAVSCLGFASQASAAATTYVLDHDQTTLSFTGRAMGHRFTGIAHSVQGILAFDPEQNTLLQPADILIHVMAMDTGNAGRDRDMRTMFEAERYPTIRFVLTALESLPHASADRALRRRYRLEGRLRIRSIEQPITFEVDAAVSPEYVEASGQTSVTLTTFDLKPPALMLGLVRVRRHVLVRFASRWTRQP